MDDGGESAPSADLYGWAGEFLEAVYCVAVVVDLPAEMALARLGATHVTDALTLPEVVERCYAAWDSVPGRGHDEYFVAATEFGRDAVTLEPNGYLCSAAEFLCPLSTGTAAFSLYANVSAQYQCAWWVDRVMQVWFDPLWPTRQEGPAAGSMDSVLAAVGFDLDAEFEPRPLAASLALAESLCGVRLTLAALSEATYMGGTVLV